MIGIRFLKRGLLADARAGAETFLHLKGEAERPILALGLPDRQRPAGVPRS